MYDFKPSGGDAATFHRELLVAADALTKDEPDAIANMANVAALLMDWLPGLNWAGFYRMVAGELVLGPFQGKAACLRIALGQGVCGAAAASGTTQRIDDVHAFPGHIACDAASNAELVVPVVHQGVVIGVIDLDSPTKGRFSTDDARAIEALAAMLAPRLCASAEQPVFTFN